MLPVPQTTGPFTYYQLSARHLWAICTFSYSGAPSNQPDEDSNPSTFKLTWLSWSKRCHKSLLKFVVRKFNNSIIHFQTNHPLLLISGNSWRANQRWLPLPTSGLSHWRMEMEVCAVFFQPEKNVWLGSSHSTSKLNVVGLDTHIKWLHNYLANRTQAVAQSPTYLYFLVSSIGLYRRPKCHSSTILKVNLFAHDILLYQFITNTTTLFSWRRLHCWVNGPPQITWHSVNLNASTWSSHVSVHTPTLPPIPLYLHNSPLKRVVSIWAFLLIVSLDLHTSLTKAMKVIGQLYRRFYGYADS